MTPEDIHTANKEMRDRSKNVGFSMCGKRLFKTESLSAHQISTEVSVNIRAVSCQLYCHRINAFLTSSYGNPPITRQLWRDVSFPGT